MFKRILFSITAFVTLIACDLLTPAPARPAAPPPTLTSTSAVIPTSTLASTEALPTETFTLVPPTDTMTPSPIPVVDSLKATVNADLLSCRYGPGPDYLYLYALRGGANIKLIGRTDGNDWVWVDGKNKCWLNAKFITIQGDPQTLKVVYPGEAKLPKSPYYPPTAIRSATRSGNNVTVEWYDVPLRAGDEEDANMLHYIIEVWHCQNGQIIFDPLATNDLSITFVDEPGCSQPSHGRVWVQEKHGFAGPTDIPWPPQK
ncbi:MAG TPA: hypothetical protein VMT73_12965 [Anaerolineales bacterium]|nr:hypothetical protein [Anaerolineales bacterium]